jgi:hypothetical protein
MTIDIYSQVLTMMGIIVGDKILDTFQKMKAKEFNKGDVHR